MPIFENGNWLNENHEQPILEFNHSLIVPNINFNEPLKDQFGNVEVPF